MSNITSVINIVKDPFGEYISMCGEPIEFNKKETIVNNESTRITNYYISQEEMLRANKYLTKDDNGMYVLRQIRNISNRTIEYVVVRGKKNDR
jgi:hypothetical protein